MTSSAQSIVQRGVRIARKFFSSKPEDFLALEGDEIRYLSKGESGTRHARNLKHVSVDQSFLGLFGSALALSLTTGEDIRIGGLDDDVASELKDRLDESILRVAVETAKERLANSADRINRACQRLHEDSYLSAWQMIRWQEEFADLKFLCVLDENILTQAEAHKDAFECRTAFVHPTDWRTERNDRWVAQELVRMKPHLDSIGKVFLTDNQREAILRHDNKVLAVAGAGTGKTSTVVGKVAYLLRTGVYQPEEILLLSFSRGAVEELRDRIRSVCGDKVEVRTFHSLGLEIVRHSTGRKPAVFEQRGSEDLIANYLTSMLQREQPNSHLVKFMAYYFYPVRSKDEFESEGEYIRYVAAHDIQTLKGERVRSYQEAQIANWLFLHGVAYVYEVEYKEADTGSLERRIYKPDFYLPDYGVYIEHFGIDRNNNTAPWVPRDKYLEDMEWKRKLHREHSTKLIETFSYQASEGNLSECLKQGLTKHGVQFKSLTAEELAELKEIRHRVRATAKLLSTTLTLFKGDRLVLSELEDRVEHTEDSSARQRENAFLAVFREVLERYEADLKEKGEIDFGDMITEAAHHVEAGTYSSPFKVFIVDEFQDISRGRAWLLNTLLEQVEDTRLLCVGDDWQSIFRFAGSDVSLMTGYEHHWPQAVRIDLDRTFRLNNKLQEASSRFVTRNPRQLKKRISCGIDKDEPAIHITDRDLPDVTRAILDKRPDASILVLGRYNHTARGEMVDVEEDAQLDSRNMTVHKAKGKEADYVIVNGLESGRYGFPTEMVDDPIIILFLSDADVYPHAEERRLFYVALTRARHEVWLRVNPSSPSCFAVELTKEPEYSGLVTCDEGVLSQNWSCPKCESPMAPQENGETGGIFLGCTNFPRCKGTVPGCPECGKAIPERRGKVVTCPTGSCDWEAEACPWCDHGFGKTINGKYGEFVGCSMFSSTGCGWKRRKAPR